MYVWSTVCTSVNAELPFSGTLITLKHVTSLKFAGVVKVVPAICAVHENRLHLRVWKGRRRMTCSLKYLQNTPKNYRTHCRNRGTHRYISLQ